MSLRLSLIDKTKARFKIMSLRLTLKDKYEAFLQKNVLETLPQGQKLYLPIEKISIG